MNPSSDEIKICIEAIKALTEAMLEEKELISALNNEISSCKKKIKDLQDLLDVEDAIPSYDIPSGQDDITFEENQIDYQTPVNAKRKLDFDAMNPRKSKK